MSSRSAAQVLSSLVLLATVLVAVPVVLSSPAQAALPSKATWLSDVRTAMSGSRGYVDRRVARGTHKPAVNLDIDNTSLASHYDNGRAVAIVLRFARHARSQGVTLLFNTGRVRGGGRMVAVAALLKRAGYSVGEVCGRTSSREGLSHSKQRCRARFANEGYTLIANVGNRSTDFTGGGYGRAFRLPSYGSQLA
ncbi:MAG: HAD family acid phosphatase [Nocardioidaceae bacterium]